MRLIKILFAFPWILLVSCEEEATFETVDELTMQAFLHADEAIDTVELRPLIPLNSSDALENLSDLEPVIYSSSGEVIPLSYLPGTDGVYAAPGISVVEGETYSIEVVYNDRIVRAESQVPSAPANVTISDTLLYRTQIVDFTDLQSLDMPDPIELNWEGEEGAYYFVHVQNISEDQEAVNLLFENEGAPPRPDFRSEPSTDAFFAINTFQEITYYGWYEATIYRVNAEYVALYEDNSSGSGNLNEIITNVENGFGIFTCLNSTKVYFEVKKT